jgi:phospholipase D1/2
MTQPGEPSSELPQEPAEFAELVVEAADGSPRELRRRIVVIFAACFVVVTIVLIGWLTPLRHSLDIDHLTQFVARFSDEPLAPLIMVGLFVVGGLIVVPVNVLTAVTILAFGPVYGSLYALIGSVLSAVVVYEIARRVPIDALRQRLGVRTQSLHGHLLRHGIVAVALIRFVPAAPYTIVNLILGMLRIDRLDYLIGTALGMAPGIVVNAFFVDRLLAAIRAPSPLTVALVAVAIAIAVGLALCVRGRLAKRAA